MYIPVFRICMKNCRHCWFSIPVFRVCMKNSRLEEWHYSLFSNFSCWWTFFVSRCVNISYVHFKVKCFVMWKCLFYVHIPVPWFKLVLIQLHETLYHHKCLSHAGAHVLTILSSVAFFVVVRNKLHIFPIRLNVKCINSIINNNYSYLSKNKTLIAQLWAQYLYMYKNET